MFDVCVAGLDACLACPNSLRSSLEHAEFPHGYLLLAFFSVPLLHLLSDHLMRPDPWMLYVRASLRAHRMQSDSSLLCSVHGGLMDDHAVVVSLGIAVGTFTRAVSFDRPSIRSVTPQNAVARGGAPLTIVGTNFGAQQFSQMVTLSGCGNCPTPELTVQVAWTSDSSMVGKVPAGRGVGHDLTVQLPAEV
jgi:hypothetical protein